VRRVWSERWRFLNIWGPGLTLSRPSGYLPVSPSPQDTFTSRCSEPRGIRGQIPTSAVELYADLSSDDWVESERSHWQRVLGCSEGLHIVESEHRSQFKNFKAALEQLERRLSMGTST